MTHPANCSFLQTKTIDLCTYTVYNYSRTARILRHTSVVLPHVFEVCEQPMPDCQCNCRTCNHACCTACAHHSPGAFSSAHTRCTRATFASASSSAHRRCTHAPIATVASTSAHHSPVHPSARTRDARAQRSREVQLSARTRAHRLPVHSRARTSTSAHRRRKRAPFASAFSSA